MPPFVQKQDLIYPELSYRLIGLAYNVFNEIGHGHLEKVYQKAYAKELKDAQIEFKEQVSYKVIYKGEQLANNFLDFFDRRKSDYRIKKK